MCRARTAAGTLFDDDTGRQVCAACTSDADCGAGKVCGLGWGTAFIEPFPACAPAAAAALGDRCLVDGECASGTCCHGVCSTCCATGGAPACAAGTTCAARAKTADGKPARTAWQCAPDGGHGAAGTACLANDDCASGTCAGGGVLSVCADGRRCASDARLPDRRARESLHRHRRRGWTMPVATRWTPMPATVRRCSARRGACSATPPTPRTSSSRCSSTCSGAASAAPTCPISFARSPRAASITCATTATAHGCWNARSRRCARWRARAATTRSSAWTC